MVNSLHGWRSCWIIGCNDAYFLHKGGVAGFVKSVKNDLGCPALGTPGPF